MASGTHPCFPSEEGMGTTASRQLAPPKAGAESRARRLGKRSACPTIRRRRQPGRSPTIRRRMRRVRARGLQRPRRRTARPAPKGIRGRRVAPYHRSCRTARYLDPSAALRAGSWQAERLPNSGVEEFFVERGFFVIAGDAVEDAVAMVDEAFRFARFEVVERVGGDQRQGDGRVDVADDGSREVCSGRPCPN